MGMSKSGAETAEEELKLSSLKHANVYPVCPLTLAAAIACDVRTKVRPFPFAFQNASGDDSTATQQTIPLKSRSRHPTGPLPRS